MTNTEARSIAVSERERLLGLLPTIDPLREKEVYRMTLDNIQTLNWLIPPEGPTLTIGEPIPVNDVHPIDNVAPFPEPSTEEYTAPVMEGAVTTDKIAGGSLPESKLSDEPAKTYTKEEVRAALAKARKKGVNVTEFLSEFGAENFTGLPAAKYPEVMARLEAL